MSGARIAGELCRAMRDGTTGAIEWRDDKRRRLFFFRAGTLVLIQSNLKSESPERVAERHPDVPADVLVELVAATRVREALGATQGDVFVHPGVGAPGFEALDLLALLWMAADRLPPMGADAWPRAVGAVAPLLSRAPLGAEVVRYLLELDGTRPLDDVVEFGPAEPEILARALAFGAALGAITTGAAVSLVVTPTTASAPPSNVTGSASLESSPAASEPPGPSPAASPPSAAAQPARRPAPSEAFSIEDIADGIQFALDQPTGEAPHPVHGRAARSAPGAGASSSGAPSSGAASSAPSSAPTSRTSPSASPGDTAAPLTAPPSASAPRPPSPHEGTPPPTPPGPSAEPPPGPFGGASATVTLGAGRPTVAAGPEPDDAEAIARFGTTLTRIRSAGDHFSVLGTSWQDGLDTHRRAYFALAQRLHPDRFTSEPASVRDVAAELFDRVRAAWEVLGDDERREAYIARTIRGEKSEEEKAMEKVRRILDAENDFKRGLTELVGGRLAAAHEHFTRAAEAAPEEAEFGAYAAYTTFRLSHGRDERAAADAAKKVHAALQANEKLDNLWVLHGIVQKTSGNEAGARAAFVHALKLKPSNPDALRELKRIEREREAAQEASGGFLSKLFKKK